jgi:hypothetical protein
MTSSLPVAANATRRGALRRNASPDRRHHPERSVAQRADGRTIIVIIQAYATPVPAGLNILNAICNYATIADAPDRDIEHTPCCVGRGVIAVTH